MKQIFGIISIFIIFSCTPKSKSGTKDNIQKKIENSTNIEVVNSISEKGLNDKLLKVDFLKYAEKSKIDSLKKYPNIYDHDNYKFCQIDAEELTEYNFDFFVPQLNKILEKRDSNFKLEVKSANDYEKTNDIFINGDKINLYTKQELESHKYLDTGPRNFFKKVNQLLESKNGDEKFYLLYGGNDLSVFLLTQEQYKIIEDFYKNDKNEIPYLP